MIEMNEDLGARIDQLSPSPKIWLWVVILSFGAFFELYDISLTASISPGLMRAGIFHLVQGGLFGLSDQATFAAATFTGLYIGTVGFSTIADRFGRKPIFTLSLIWYAVATVAMGVQNTSLGVDLWRLIAGVGVGVELVVIDCYIAELMPKAVRGRAFALSAFIQFLAVPVVAVLAAVLTPRVLLGVQGWRWLAFVPAIGACLVWIVRLGLPESPRWLAEHGRSAEVAAIIASIEGSRRNATPPEHHPEAVHASVVDEKSRVKQSMWARPHRQRLIMLSVFQIFQTVGFYGFANWAPTLLLTQGVNVSKSLLYSAAIAVAYPLSPLGFYFFADRVERKWQIVLGALGGAVFGIIFARQRAALGWISSGLLVSVSTNLMSYAYHAYQSELFPTAMRARAVGFAYSFSRLSAVFSSFLIAFFLRDFGVKGVFTFITGAMVIVMVTIGVFGPRTLNRAFEELTT